MKKTTKTLSIIYSALVVAWLLFCDIYRICLLGGGDVTVLISMKNTVLFIVLPLAIQLVALLFAKSRAFDILALISLFLSWFIISPFTVYIGIYIAYLGVFIIKKNSFKKAIVMILLVFALLNVILYAALNLLTLSDKQLSKTDVIYSENNEFEVIIRDWTDGNGKFAYASVAYRKNTEDSKFIFTVRPDERPLGNVNEESYTVEWTDDQRLKINGKTFTIRR